MTIIPDDHEPAYQRRSQERADFWHPTGGRGGRLQLGGCAALDVGGLMRDWLSAAAAGFLEIEGSRTRMAPGLPGVDSSQRPGPQSVLNASVQAVAAVLPVHEDPGAGSPHRGSAIIRTA